jgi:hypothetical protein
MCSIYTIISVEILLNLGYLNKYIRYKLSTLRAYNSGNYKRSIGK